MNQNIFMQVPVDAGLRASFTEAAAREHRPAAQVLQQLMRDYVVRHPAAEQGPCFENDTRDPEDLARRLHGWRTSPFGVD